MSRVSFKAVRRGNKPARKHTVTWQNQHEIGHVFQGLDRTWRWHDYQTCIHWSADDLTVLLRKLRKLNKAGRAR